MRLLTQRAVERVKGIRAVKKEYDDMSIDEIHETILKEAVAIANQNERLKKRLDEKS